MNCCNYCNMRQAKVASRRLSQNGERLDVLFMFRDTLTQNRRQIGNTHPTVSSSWNSVNLLSSRPDGPVG